VIVRLEQALTGRLEVGSQAVFAARGRWACCCTWRLLVVSSKVTTVYPLECELILVDAKLLTRLIPHLSQVLRRRSGNLKRPRVRVEDHDVRHYADRNSLYRPWARRKAAGALSSRTAREYQQSQRCALRVVSLRSTSRIRLAMWRSFASAKLSRRLLGPAMRRLGTEHTMSRTVNAGALTSSVGFCEGWRSSYQDS
jgi:hypothetical protein